MKGFWPVYLCGCVATALVFVFFINPNAREAGRSEGYAAAVDSVRTTRVTLDAYDERDSCFRVVEVLGRSARIKRPDVRRILIVLPSTFVPYGNPPFADSIADSVWLNVTRTHDYDRLAAEAAKATWDSIDFDVSPPRAYHRIGDDYVWMRDYHIAERKADSAATARYRARHR